MRRIVIGLGLLYLLVAGILWFAGLQSLFLVWLVLNGVLILVAVLGERWRYRPRVDRRRGRWQATGEHFVDPASGRLIDVYYNPDTGERDYVDAGAAPPPPG